MNGSWLRNSHATILGAAMMTAAVLVWPFPANTSVYSPNPIVESLPVSAEEDARAPVVGETDLAATQEPQLQQISAPALGGIARRLPTPRARPAPAPREPLLPNLFGTVARATTNTPGNWAEHVAQSADAFETCIEGDTACGGDADRWRTEAERLEALPLRQRLARANSFVNNAIRFRSDVAATGQRDSWISPAQLFRTRTGDCEDYALAKYWLLRAAGVAEEDMFVMVVADLVARADHAYLAVRIGEEFVLLDSRTDLVLTPERVDDITPLITIGTRGAYLHGRPA